MSLPLHERDSITKKIIGAAIEVHRNLGPGLLENAYENALCHEFGLRSLPFARQLPIQPSYKGIDLGVRYKVDLVVANLIVVEVKSVPRLLSVHEAQLTTYLRFGGWPAGLLLNFDVAMMRNGIRRRELW
jgi:GxxExxY protein